MIWWVWYYRYSQRFLSLMVKWHLHSADRLLAIWKTIHKRADAYVDSFE